MRRIAVSAVVAAVLAVGPASAGAFTVTVPKAAPASTAAGANADFALQVQFADGTPKDLAIDLPPGLIGDPTGTPRCPVATFTAGKCTDASKVGTANAQVTALGLPVSAPGNVYNLVPNAGEPARLGIALKPSVGAPLYSQSAISVRPDGGLTSTVTGLPKEQDGLPISITSLSLTLLGKAGGGTFMRNPTSCGAATTVVRAVPHEGAPAAGSAAFTPTACDALPFDPKLVATLGGKGQTGETGKPGLSTEITQAKGEAGARTVAVTLPQGVGAQITALARACPADQDAAGTCAPASQIGTASAVVGVLPEPLTGAVRLLQGSGSLPDVGVALTGVISQRLRGVSSAGASGITTTFDDIPDVPLADFKLVFNAGEAGLLQNQRDLCTSNPPLAATITSQGGVARQLSVTPTVEGCARTLKRKRSTRASVRLSRVGGARGRAVRLRLKARARGARLRRVTLTLPKTLRISPRRAKARTPRGAKLRIRSSRTLRVTLAGKGARSATITLRKGLRAKPALRRAKGRRTLRFKVAATYVGGGSGKATAKTRTRR